MMRGSALRARLLRSACVLASTLLATTCTSSNDCAAGNPLMPVCFDPSPAEPRLLFLRSPDATWLRADIYTMNADGTNVRALTTHGRAWSPAWSPDGARIAFAKFAEGSDVLSQIYVVDANGRNERNLSNKTTALEYSPTWSPDGQRVVFQSNRHDLPNACCETSIYVMNGDGSNVQRLTANSDDAYPRWSPDGSTITFASTRTGGAWQVFAMNADGSNVRQLTTQKSNGRSVWSPDGTQLAFEVWRPAAGGGGMDNGIYVMNADGSGQMRVSQTTKTDMNPTWSSDKRDIFFCSNRSLNGRMHVYVTSMNGGVARLLSGDETEDCYPDFKPPRRR